MFTHKGTQTLETERLILRRFSADDAAAMFTNYANDDEVTKFMRFATHTSVEVSKNYLLSCEENYKKLNYYHWAIQTKEGECIGSLSAFVDDFDFKADLGYCIGRAYWNKGYTSEAVSAVIEFLFDEVGLNKVEAYHSVNNPASGKVMQKAGMVKEGHAKQKYYCRMGFQDCDCYGITKEDYQKEAVKKEKPIIETERLILRGFRKDDLGDFYEYSKNPAVGPNAG